MKIVTHPGSKLGDTILMEPAIAAYYRHTGTKAQWCLPEPIRSLFVGHPEIDFTDDPTGGIELSCTAAFRFATSAGWYFALGYWRQLGLTPRREDRQRIRTTCDLHLHYPFDVVIVPFCGCCASHRGERANVQPPLDWWQPIVQAFPEVVCLASPEWPDIPGAVNLRDLTLVEALSVLAYAKVIITVETGLLHLASSVTDRIVFLSSATPSTLCRVPGSSDRWTTFVAPRPDQFPVTDVIKRARMYL